jgi:hypothetical protein
LFINNLISKPVTHITYAVGNELMTLWKAVPETMGAALIGSAREAAGMATADRVYWGEVGAGLYALGRGTKAGLMAAGKALWTGKPVLLPKEKSVSLALQERHAGAIGGLAGEVIRSPTRMVAAIHALSRFQNYFISISQQAYRQAMAEGLTGSEFSARVAQLESNPDAKMMGIAQADATNTALMGRGGEFSQAVVRLSNARLMGTKLPKLIVPFAQVSSNIMGQGLLERSPLGLLAPDIRANLRAGGARADTQIARIVAGSALGVVAMMMAVDGNITGDGPSDPKDRAAWLAMGNQPYSIRIGDTWYQYGRLGPISKPIGLAADLWQVGQAMGEKDVAAVAAMISLSMSKLVLDESSMRGIHEALGAVEDPQRNGARWIKQFATSFIPFSQAVGQVAREVDPLDRQARSLLDAFQSRIPGLSEGLPARIDVFGQPVPQRTSLGGLGITSIYTSRETNDPTIRALADLQLRGVPVWPAMPKAQIQGVQLSDRQYEEYAMMTGKLRKQLLDTYVANPSWQANVPDGIKAEQIRGDMERARMMAEQAMLRKPNGIAQAATAYKIEMMRTGRRQPVTTE